MKTIPLTQGKVALVDDADYEAVSQFKWYTKKSGRVFYAVRNIQTSDGQRQITMHRFLMPRAKEIDHIDGNGLNNQRLNLRSCSHKENVRAFQSKRGDTSSFRGVHWKKANQKWQSSIGGIYLGLFINEIEAAKAYDAAARQHFGEFACPNFPL